MIRMAFLFFIGFLCSEKASATHHYSNNQIVYFHNYGFLKIANFDVSGRIPMLVEKHPKISRLIMEHCGVLTAQDIIDLEGFKNLQYLKISDGGFTDILMRVLSLRDLSQKLITLDVSDHTLTDNGLLNMLEAGKFTALKQLCLWNEKDTDFISEVSFNQLAISPLANQLVVFCISGRRIKRDDLTAESRKFIKLKLREYERFYNPKIDDNEAYMLDDPLEDGRTWTQISGKWFLKSNDVDSDSDNQIGSKKVPITEYNKVTESWDGNTHEFYCDSSDSDGTFEEM